MYATLITAIKGILATVTEVEDYFEYPKTKIDKFPAVYFQPAGFTNAFETGSENSKTYRFLMIVIVGADQGKPVSDVFATVLPAVVDAIVAKFDQAWDIGTISGHRSWVKIDSADPWEVQQDQDGIMCYAPLNVEIKLLTSV